MGEEDEDEGTRMVMFCEYGSKAIFFVSFLITFLEYNFGCSTEKW
jgi:hypothetical protein